MIFDCFVFFNELDLLEIRLNELDPVVDHFVLCEAPVTFRGKPKPLYFKENRERFEPFLSKITHVLVDDMPQGRDHETAYWIKQTFQRNAIRRGLAEATADDLIVLSDLDEIPSAAAVESVARNFRKPAIFSFIMDDHQYFVNVRRRGSWAKARMARLGDVRSMERLRDGGPTWRPNLPHFLHTMRQWKRMAFGMRRLRPWIAVPGAGWHFSNMNGPEEVSRKFHAVSGVRPESATSIEGVSSRMKTVLEQVSRQPDGASHRLVDLDASFPAYLLANRTRFSHLIADRGTFQAFGVEPPGTPQCPRRNDP